MVEGRAPSSSRAGMTILRRVRGSITRISCFLEKAESKNIFALGLFILGRLDAMA
jgi:hypothetical protein